MWNWIKQLDRILSGEATHMASLREGTIEIPAAGLCVVIFALAVTYGACMGVFAAFRPETPCYGQLLASAVKVPALFFLTLAITFPSLYIFNTLVGSRLSMLAVARLLVASLGVNVTVLASLGPILAFFSLCTTSYSFIILLNVVFFAMSGGFGTAFLLKTLNGITLAFYEPAPPEVPPRVAEGMPTISAGGDAPTVPSSAGVVGSPFPAKVPSHRSRHSIVPQVVEVQAALQRLEAGMSARRVKVVFNCWVVIVGVVGAQLAWILRPLIGAPDKPFAWFRARESNVFEAVFTTLLSLFQ